jgi:hypothetical protein
MTAYFDAKQTELRGLVAGALDSWEEFEQRIIQDVANMGELFRTEGGTAAFPEDLRDAAYSVLLRFSPCAWPTGLKYGGPDYEDVAAYRHGLSLMIEELHSILHEAARRGWDGGDSIQHPVRVANARMEERCSEIAVAAGAERAPWLVRFEEERAAERAAQGEQV